MSDIELRRRCRAEHFTFDGYSFDLLLHSPFSGDEKALMEAQVGALQSEVLGDCTLGGGNKTLEEAQKMENVGDVECIEEVEGGEETMNKCSDERIDTEHCLNQGKGEGLSEVRLSFVDVVTCLNDKL